MTPADMEPGCRWGQGAYGDRAEMWPGRRCGQSGYGTGANSGLDRIWDKGGDVVRRIGGYGGDVTKA